jgi:hypothetical protein
MAAKIVELVQGLNDTGDDRCLLPVNGPLPGETDILPFGADFGQGFSLSAATQRSSTLLKKKGIVASVLFLYIGLAARCLPQFPGGKATQ